MKLTNAIRIGAAVVLLNLAACAIYKPEGRNTPMLSPSESDHKPWKAHGPLRAVDHHILHEDGTPFLWIGDTAWDLYVNADREEIRLYLDNRKAKGVNVIQAVAYPMDYLTKTDNAPNAYGHHPFEGDDPIHDLGKPRLAPGGSADAPTDYWDHSDFLVRETRARGQYLGLLPCWGSGLINNKAWGQWLDVQFTADQARAYGKFLGDRYKNEPHIVWILGGDTMPDSAPGNKHDVHVAMVEGIVEGVTGKTPAYNEPHEAWDSVFMTYHSPRTSSQWFHEDPWLDFNMIQTQKSIHRVVDRISKEYQLKPVKPTLNGEPRYEQTDLERVVISRNFFHTFFSGGVGYTYGSMVWTFYTGRKELVPGKPSTPPLQHFQEFLDMPAAMTLPILKGFIASRRWEKWIPAPDVFANGKGEPGTVEEKVAVKSSVGDEILVYYADNSAAEIHLNQITASDNARGVWFDPGNGNTESAGTDYSTSKSRSFTPPEGWEDAVLILEAQ